MRSMFGVRPIGVPKLRAKFLRMNRDVAKGHLAEALEDAAAIQARPVPSNGAVIFIRRRPPF
jgi:hypothetical protein